MKQTNFSDKHTQEVILGGKKHEIVFEPYGVSAKDVDVFAKTQQKGDNLLVTLVGRNGDGKPKEIGKIKVGYCPQKGFTQYKTHPPEIKPIAGMNHSEDYLDISFTRGKFNFSFEVREPEKEYSLDENLAGFNFGSPEDDSPLELMVKQEPEKPVKKREFIPSYDISDGRYLVSKLFTINSKSSDTVFNTEEVTPGNVTGILHQSYLTHKKVGGQGKNILDTRDQGKTEFSYIPNGRLDIRKPQSKDSKKTYVVRKPNQLWILFPYNDLCEFTKINGDEIANQLAYIDNVKTIPTALKVLGKSTTEYNPKASYTLAVVDIPEKHKKR